MSLFQKTIVTKYQLSQNAELILEKWHSYQAHFLNPTIQENIKNSKEEQYQAGFLRDLFVNILGYTLNPDSDFNLTTELKNVKDSKKADGGILVGDKVAGVIELKGTNTTDLSKVETQAFGYKNNQPNCTYVIISNFEKLRFYIDNAIEHIEFDLFTLTQSEFELLYLCLAYENIKQDLPKKIQSESLSKEDAITKTLYKDYSAFKRELFTNLTELNPQFDSLLLFEKSQKLLDRFLFIFFAEDRGLLPPNFIRYVIKNWGKLIELDEDVSLYERFKKNFNYLYEGHENRDRTIFAYNGGLFKSDEVLDNVTIDDDLLHRHTLKLSEYDFNSEVDVNILGHIFENSLNEIEEIQAELAGESTDKSKSKRKKDGVFYTPKYITKYIVENTIGKLCEEKKAELGIYDTDYTAEKRRQKRTQSALLEKLNTYRAWLLQISIVDPACGSGAFLNEALAFLIDEHDYIRELEGKLLGDSLPIPNIENTILENNLFGVDINEESVEIAKLSLWLRTAKKDRKLNSLSNNLKCGNSLIDDPEVAGDKAFNWQNEFPKIFEKGGFDVVIGNPPYVQLQSMGEMSGILSQYGFETFDKGADIYCLFTERGYNLLKQGGIQSFIMPNKWMLVAYGKPLRQFLSKTGLRQILNFGDIQFFEGAVTIVCIFVTQKAKPYDIVKAVSLNQKNYDGDFYASVMENQYDYPMAKFGKSEWSIRPYEDNIKLEQMEINSVALKELPIAIYYGIKTGYNDAFYIDAATRQQLVAEDPNSESIIKPMVRGRDIVAYGITGYEYLISTFPALNLDIDNYPAVKRHLLSFGYERLKQVGGKGSRKKTNGEWFETQDSIAYYQEFNKPKIIYPNMTSVFPFMYDESEVLSNDKSFILTASDDNVSLLYLTAVFNSSLAKLWIWYNCPELQGGTREIRKVYFEHFPVPKADDNQTKRLENYVEQRITLNKSFFEITDKFIRTLQRKFETLDKLPKKLEDWHELSFSDFIKELKKKKVKLSLSEESEWEDYFLAEQQKATALKTEIDKTDKAIDTMVYALYGLTDEEIDIVENG